jgi:transcription termination factor Rho
MNFTELENAPLAELRDKARDLNVPHANRLKKKNLILRIRQADAEKEGLEVRGGILEIMPEGIGFLRSNYQIGPDDVYVSQAQLRRYELRNGDLVIGQAARRGNQNGITGCKKSNRSTASIRKKRAAAAVEKLTPIFPDKRFDLETNRGILSNRLINLLPRLARAARHDRFTA